MTFRDTVLKAARAAARHAMPELPEGLVRWREDSNKQPGPKHPTVLMETVSLVSNGTISLHQELQNNGETLTREFAQRWFWTVQFRVEGWKLDSDGNNNPESFTRRMRFGWRTLAAQRALDDLPSNRPFQARFPVKMVNDPGDIRDITLPAAGHNLPKYLYEIEFSYVEYDVDSEKDATLDGATITGEIGGTAHDDLVTLDV